MTLSYGGADVTGSPSPKHPRPTRAAYVPPHIRNATVSSAPSSNVSFGYAAPTASDSHSYYSHSNRFAGRSGSGSGSSRGRGRGGGGRGRGGRGRWSSRPRELGDPFPNSSTSPRTDHFDGSETFDAIEKFDDLEVIDDCEVGCGDAINFDAYEDIPVEKSGSDIPPPVNTFAEIDLGNGLNDNIRRCKYVKPTPVQRHAIPIAVAGRDLMACAQTGSGKTAAFCFPIIRGILRSQSSHPVLHRSTSVVAYPLALILSPTRELSCQIHDEAKKFAYKTGVKIAVAYGGAPISQQFRNLGKGVDILVATPGRLVDMIERARVSLKMIKYLALDEADRMLDMGFEPQIRKLVELMDMPPPGIRQTVLFSATFPDEIQRLASDFLSNYVFLAVGRVGSSTDLIVQRVDYVRDTDKRQHLMKILCEKMASGSHGKHALTLVFVETKRSADALEYWLSTNGFPATAIHGDKVQMERERSLKSFRSGSRPIMVATDVAARGLDIPHVSHVINFDFPKDIDDYVHRIGRTGRAGKSGMATAFFSDKNLPLAKALVELMKEAKQEVPHWLRQFADKSSHGGGGSRAHRSGSNRFGGHDYRSRAQSKMENDHYANSYGHAARAPYATATTNYYPDADVGSYSHAYAPASPGYELGHESIVATGWD